MAAHLDNIACLEAALPLREDDVLVLAAANQVFFRPCAPFLRRHSLSFAAGVRTDTKWHLREDRFVDPVTYSSADWHLEASGRSTAPRRACPGPAARPSSNGLCGLSSNFAPQAGAAARTVFTRSHAPFAELLRRHTPTGWQPSPLAYMPHEGTFFPLSLLRGFAAALRPTPFAPDRVAAGGVCALPRTWCAAAPLAGTGRDTGKAAAAAHQRANAHEGGLTSACRQPQEACSILYEELLLPSYVMQFHKPLALRGTPPLVTRVWGTTNPKGANNAPILGLVANASFMHGFVEQLFAHLREPAFLAERQYLCGVKVPTVVFGVSHAHKRSARGLSGYDSLLWQMLAAARGERRGSWATGEDAFVEVT